MNKLMATKGYSLIEILVGVSILGIVVLAGTALMTQVVKESTQAQLANELLIDQTLGAKIVNDDLSNAGINLNMTHVLDSKEKEFFEYQPYNPESGSDGNEERQLILSLDDSAYPGAVRELVFLRSDEAWPLPLTFSPRKAFLSGPSCREANSLFFNGKCLFEKIIKPEAIANFTQKQYDRTKGAYFYFQLPEYFINHSKDHLQTKLISYSFLAPADSDTKNAKVFPANIFRSNDKVPSLSTDIQQSNLYTVIEALHPSGKFNLDTLSTYLKKIPFYAGEGTSFQLSRVRIIKYLVEPIKIKGKDSSALYRIELERQTGTRFKLVSSVMVTEGFNAVIFTRKAVKLPILNVYFERQFKVDGSTKGE